MGANLVNIEDILDGIELQKGVGDYTARKTRYQLKAIALDGVRELDNSQNVNQLDILLEVESDGSIPVPDDYLDYVAIFILNEENVLVPLTKNKNINTAVDPILDHTGDPILDHNGEKIYASTAKTSTASSSLINSNDNRRFSINSRTYASSQYGLGGGFNKYGYFKDEVTRHNNSIFLDVPDTVEEVVLSYLTDTVDFLYDVLIPAIYRESLITWINWKCVQHNTRFTSRDKERAKRDYYRERRNARKKPLRLSEWIDNHNKQMKQSLKF